MKTPSCHKFETLDDCVQELNRFSVRDRSMVYEYLKRFNPVSCEYNFVNLFCWAAIYDYTWFIHDGRLVIHDGLDQVLFMPIGETCDPGQLSRISNKAVSMGLSGDICLVSSSYMDHFEDIEQFYIPEQDRDGAEYIYLTENLANLTGTKLHKKRNLISQFKRLYPDFKVSVMTIADMGRIKLFAADLLGRMDPLPDTLVQEFCAMEKAFEHWLLLDLQGLILWVDGQVAAFSVFSQDKPDAASVHFEKSNIEFKGAAQVINQETARYLSGKAVYINREQDLGITGLRRAKLSYDPHRLWTPWFLKFKDTI